MNGYVAACAGTATVRLALDMLWMGIIARPLYQRDIDHPMTAKPNVAVAVACQRTPVPQRAGQPWAARRAAPWLLLMPALLPVASASESPLMPPAATPLRGGVWPVSPQARLLADWVARSGDHAGAPFIIVDKKRARVLVFEPSAHLRAHSAVLLGAALGDVSVPGIGTRPMAQILPAERTTPAGRFVAERGRNTQGEDVVWVDYDAAVSMHRVRTGHRAERRAQRLASPGIADNRISYGCINVPAAFYESAIQPIFARRKAMVYVLPDILPVQQVFGHLQPASAALSARRAVRSPTISGTVAFGNGRAWPKR